MRRYEFYYRYDTPTTPHQRLLAAGVLSNSQRDELTQYRANLNVVQIAHDVNHIQQRLTALAAAAMPPGHAFRPPPYGNNLAHLPLVM